MIQQLALFGAAVLAGAGVLIHTMAGGRVVVTPLLADQSLSRATRWLAYCCWHIVTLLMGLIAAGFALLSLGVVHRDLGYFLVATCLSISVLCFGIAIAGKFKPLRFPPVSLFFLLGVIGLFGLW